jgi:nucleoside-diphosphate-sugar epimerase
MNRPPYLAAYAGRTALVFGASGFIGRWIARGLTQAGAHVVAVVRDPAAASAVFADYAVKADTIWCDLEDRSAIAPLVRRVRPSVTFNLAGYGVDRTEQDPDRARRINADLPAALLEALEGIPDPGWQGYHLVHTGSALEYGNAGGHLAEASRAEPTTTYGITKLAGTRQVECCDAATGVRAVTARLFTVYGPGEHHGRLLPVLLAAQAGSGAIPLSEGLQRRDFTYVGDVMEGLLRLGVSAGPPGWTVNLATGNLASVRDFVEVAAQVLHIDGNRLHFGDLPTRPDEIEHLDVTVQRLRELLGWVPSTTVASGIRQTRVFLQGIAQAGGV